MAGLILDSAPALLPLTVTEVKTHLRLDSSQGEISPGAPTLALAGSGSGNVDNGAHRYRVTFVTADGETEGGTISSAVTVTDKTTNGKVALTAIPTGGSAITSRKIYRTVAAGSTYLFLATLSDNSTTIYTDNIADSSLGAAAPSTNTTEDPYLTSLIKTATLQAEDITKRRFITQTWKIYLDNFPCSSWIEIPHSPLQSISSIQYIDGEGDTQTFSSSLYNVSVARERGRIQLNIGEVWPQTQRRQDAVIITAVVGYGAARSAVPEPIKQAMLLMLGHWYNQREDVVFGVVGTKVPNTSQALLSPYTSFEV